MRKAGCRAVGLSLHPSPRLPMAGDIRYVLNEAQKHGLDPALALLTPLVPAREDIYWTNRTSTPAQPASADGISLPEPTPAQQPERLSGQSDALPRDRENRPDVSQSQPATETRTAANASVIQTPQNPVENVQRVRPRLDLQEESARVAEQTYESAPRASKSVAQSGMEPVVHRDISDLTVPTATTDDKRLHRDTITCSAPHALQARFTPQVGVQPRDLALMVQEDTEADRRCLG